MRAVSKSGVLVIRYHRKPIGVLGSPTILRDILIGWRFSGAPPTRSHPVIWDELALLADSAKPMPSQPFHPRSINVQMQPSSIVGFLRDLAKGDGGCVILHRRRVYAFLLPLTLLARFRQTGRAQSSEWLDEVLNWMCQPEESYRNQGLDNIPQFGGHL